MTTSALTIIILAALQQLADCIQCYACSSQFTTLEPSLKLQLQKQGVFFPPPSGFDPSCHLPVDQIPNPAAQICTSPTCLTLTPHVSGINFTVRGCAESLLKHSFRSGEDLTVSGCRVFEARDAFGAAFSDPLRLILCSCDTDWCNGQPQPLWDTRLTNDTATQSPASTTLPTTTLILIASLICRW